MKRKIDGITYDTDKADLVQTAWFGIACGCGGGASTLYLMPKSGAYFFHHIEPERIEPIDSRSAKVWRIDQYRAFLAELTDSKPDLMDILRRLDGPVVQGTLW